MKKKFLIILLFIPCLCYSRMQPIEKRMLGITFSPEYSYRFLTSPAAYDWLVDLRDGMEVPKLGYTVGFNFSYKLRNKLFMSVAACYSNKGEETKKSDLIYVQPTVSDPVSIYTRYTYGFCEIPIKLNYQVFDSSSFFTSLGIALDVPVWEKVKNLYTYSDGSVAKGSSITPESSARICLSAVAGMGYYFKIGKHYYLKTEPFFKCNITPAIGTKVKEYFYSYGLDIGFFLGR